jgi:hypothetical protein
MELVLSDLLAQVFMLLGVLLASFALALLKKQVGVQKLKQIEAELTAKQEIVDTVVLFVQQVYATYDGEEKYKLALARATDLMNKKGLKITPEELESLIESSVKLMKKEFGDAWKKEVHGTPLNE